MDGIYRLIASALLCLLCGCGAVGFQAPAPQEDPKILLVIGNSISRHPPAPDIGWSGDWGMAASSADKDFAHVAGSILGRPVTVINFATLERDPTSAMTDIKAMTSTIDSRTLVVIELGDNVMPAVLDSFRPAYDLLLKNASSGQALLCVSTFWEKASTDAAIKTICEANGGHYLYIGDIYGSVEGFAERAANEFPDPAVNGHPHDWSMSQIGQRVASSLQTQNVHRF
jgi:hypothetical protein